MGQQRRCRSRPRLPVLGKVHQLRRILPRFQTCPGDVVKQFQVIDRPVAVEINLARGRRDLLGVGAAVIVKIHRRRQVQAPGSPPPPLKKFQGLAGTHVINLINPVFREQIAPIGFAQEIHIHKVAQVKAAGGGISAACPGTSARICVGIGARTCVGTRATLGVGLGQGDRIAVKRRQRQPLR